MAVRSSKGLGLLRVRSTDKLRESSRKVGLIKLQRELQLIAVGCSRPSDSANGYVTSDSCLHMERELLFSRQQLGLSLEQLVYPLQFSGEAFYVFSLQPWLDMATETGQCDVHCRPAPA